MNHKYYSNSNQFELIIQGNKENTFFLRYEKYFFDSIQLYT